MEYQVEPYFLKIKDVNENYCPICNQLFEKKTKIVPRLNGSECYDCNYGMRPFCHSKGTCFCEYIDKEVLFITCNNCNNPKCLKCNVEISIYQINSKYCKSCTEIQKKEEFKNKWISSSAEEKLIFYGIEKLEKLAKLKEIKGFSKLSKKELCDKLKNIVSDSDFPIK